MWRVTPISQKSVQLCWEACGHMLWNWRYKDEKMRANYKMRSGIYANMDHGLPETGMDHFYKLLGIRSLPHPRGENIVHALKWSPVIVMSVDQAYGHAMVIDGHLGPHYNIINPCAQMVVNFGTDNSDSCAVGTINIKKTEFDRKLGKFIWYW
jgi:hypothetical protein